MNTYQMLSHIVFLQTLNIFNLIIYRCEERVQHSDSESCIGALVFKYCNED